MTAKLDPARFHLRSTVRAMERDGDPMRPVLGEGVDVDALLEALGARLASD